MSQNTTRWSLLPSSWGTMLLFGGRTLRNSGNVKEKSHIVTWAKMKKVLKKKYLQDHYRQDDFLMLHSFWQNKLSVEEYTTEFDHSIMHCNIVESEEQMVVHYLGGLRFKINNGVQLQPYWTYNDVWRDNWRNSAGVPIDFSIKEESPTEEVVPLPRTLHIPRMQLLNQPRVKPNNQPKMKLQ